MNKLNRENYSKKTLTVFEIVGAYFVDVIYHHLYETSKKTHRLGSSESRSLTDDYKIALSAYIDGVCTNKEYFGRTIKGILESYRLNTRFSSISMNAFISEILEQFIPEEHLSVLGETEKHFFIHKIITRLVRIFIEKVSSPSMMKMVIDDRVHENNNIYHWIDEAVDCQIIIREELVNQFVRQVTGQTAVEQIDLDVVRKITEDRNKLWASVQELIKIKQSLAAQLSKSKQVAVQLVSKLSSATELIKSKNDHIDSINAKFKDAIEELDSTITKLREDAVSNTITINKLKNKNAELREQITQANIHDDYDILSETNLTGGKSPFDVIATELDQSDTTPADLNQSEVTTADETVTDLNQSEVTPAELDQSKVTPADLNQSEVTPADETVTDLNQSEFAPIDAAPADNTEDDDDEDTLFDLDEFLKNDPLNKIRSSIQSDESSLM